MKYPYHCVLALLATASFPSIAAAQSTASAPQESQASDSGYPADIIVTAQRRSESLQNVPITITAVQGETLQASGVESTFDLPAVTPGLVMTAQRNGVTPYLRGVGTQSGSSEQAVAVYVDNIYIANSAAAMFQLNNVERIEVLKGPQGTLFGRNATGGLINVITKDPSHTTEVKLSAGYGNYGTYTGNVYATTGLTESIAMDFAAYGSYQSDGWGENLYTGNEVNISRSFALRSKIKADIGDSTYAVLSGDYAYTKTDFGNTRQPIPGSLTQPSAAYPAGLTSIGSIYDANSDVPFGPRYGTKQWGLSLKVNHDFSDALSLTSTTAYRNHDFPSLTDTDSTPDNGVSGYFVEKGNSFQQEFLLNGEWGPVQMTGGLFYFRYERGMQPLQVFSAVPARRSWRTTNATTNSYSAFGQLTYAIGPDTNITGGLRYTKEDVSATGVIRSGTATSPITFDTSTRTDGIPNSETFKKLTWRASIDHHFTPNFMVYASWNRGFKSGTYNIFAINDLPTEPETLDAYETGFKAELFDRRLQFNGAAFWYDYKDIQVSTVLTVGTGDRNAASGRIKGLEAELNYRAPVATGSLTLRGSLTYLDTEYRNYTNALANVPNVNIGGTVYSGSTLCARAAAGQSLNGTPTGGNSTCVLDASGRKMARAPGFTSNLGADFQIPLSNTLDLGINMNWQHTGNFYWDPYNLFPNGSYDIVNGQITIGPDDGRWDVRLWGRNLTKTEYFSQVAPSGTSTAGVPGAPRTYGITLDVKFGG